MGRTARPTRLRALDRPLPAYLPGPNGRGNQPQDERPRTHKRRRPAQGRLGAPLSAETVAREPREDRGGEFPTPVGKGLNLKKTRNKNCDVEAHTSLHQQPPLAAASQTGDRHFPLPLLLSSLHQPQTKEDRGPRHLDSLPSSCHAPASPAPRAALGPMLALPPPSAPFCAVRPAPVGLLVPYRRHARLSARGPTDPPGLVTTPAPLVPHRLPWARHQALRVPSRDCEAQGHGPRRTERWRTRTRAGRRPGTPRASVVATEGPGRPAPPFGAPTPHSPSFVWAPRPPTAWARGAREWCGRGARPSPRRGLSRGAPAALLPPRRRTNKRPSEDPRGRRRARAG